MTCASVPSHVRDAAGWRLVVGRRMRTCYRHRLCRKPRKIAEFSAILLYGADAQASRGQVDFDEKRDVGARDENHRAYEQQRDGPGKT